MISHPLYLMQGMMQHLADCSYGQCVHPADCFQDHEVHAMRSTLENLTRYYHSHSQNHNHKDKKRSSSSSSSSRGLQDSELQELRRTIKELSAGAQQHSVAAAAVTAQGYGDHGASAFSPGAPRRHSAQTSGSGRHDGSHTPGKITG
jgi:hypothetical protein